MSGTKIDGHGRRVADDVRTLEKRVYRLEAALDALFQMHDCAGADDCAICTMRQEMERKPMTRRPTRAVILTAEEASMLLSCEHLVVETWSPILLWEEVLGRRRGDALWEAFYDTDFPHDMTDIDCIASIMRIVPARNGAKVARAKARRGRR